jgi:hypothetical protein
MRHIRTRAEIQIGTNFLHIDIVYKSCANWDMDGGRWQDWDWKNNQPRFTAIPQSLIDAITEGSSYDIVGACSDAVAHDIANRQGLI